MKLQPIYPTHPRVTVVCTKCGGKCDSLHGFADLDAPAGTFYCAPCAGAPGYKVRQHLEHRMMAAGADYSRAIDEGRHDRDALREAHSKACDRYHGFHY